MSERIVEEWKEKLLEMSKYIASFANSLDKMESEDGFEAVYHCLRAYNADAARIVEDMRTESGGIAALKEAISKRGEV